MHLHKIYINSHTVILFKSTKCLIFFEIVTEQEFIIARQLLKIFLKFILIFTMKFLLTLTNRNI